MKWFPTGGGLRDEDWTRRHRLLLLMLAWWLPVLTVYGGLRGSIHTPWLITVLIMLACLVAAVLVKGKRLAS